MPDPDYYSGDDGYQYDSPPSQYSPSPVRPPRSPAGGYKPSSRRYSRDSGYYKGAESTAVQGRQVDDYDWDMSPATGRVRRDSYDTGRRGSQSRRSSGGRYSADGYGKGGERRNSLEVPRRGSRSQDPGYDYQPARRRSQTSEQSREERHGYGREMDAYEYSNYGDKSRGKGKISMF